MTLQVKLNGNNFLQSLLRANMRAPTRSEVDDVMRERSEIELDEMR